MRQIALDTETTGLSPHHGHRIVEIGCVEIVNRKVTNNSFQAYFNPERSMDEGAFRVTGLADDFLATKPLFKAGINDFIDFISGANEIIIHNAKFDLGFLEHEFKLQQLSFNQLLEQKNIKILDTLLIAREKYPGQKNSLDALCNRLEVKHFAREKHGALLDAKILAEVYLKLTAEQFNFFAALSDNLTKELSVSSQHDIKSILSSISSKDQAEHNKFISLISSKSKKNIDWKY